MIETSAFSIHLRHRLLEQRELAKVATTDTAREAHETLAMLYAERLAAADIEKHRAA